MKKRIGVLTLLSLAMLLALPAPAPAIELTGEGTLTSGAFLPEVGDDVHVFLVDFGPRPIRAEIQMVRADDLSVVATSGPLTVPSGSGISKVFIPSDFPVLIVVRFRVQGSTTARLSLQVVDPTGATKIFTDGFESGDLAG